MKIFLIEDNSADAGLTCELLREAQPGVSVTVAENGERGLTMLRDEERQVRPDLILLDLNLPGKEGLEVLKDLKSDPSLATIPVIILTTSSSPLDVQRAYQSHANAYIKKPVLLAEYERVIEAVRDFWGTVAVTAT